MSLKCLSMQRPQPNSPDSTTSLPPPLPPHLHPPSCHPGIPFLFFLVFLPLSLPWVEGQWWLCLVHYLACLSPTVGSVLYHIFMNHEGGAHVYDTLLSLDMFGVCLVNTLGRLGQ